MHGLRPTLKVEAAAPSSGRRTRITWVDSEFEVEGDNHVAHGGEGAGPDGFDLLAAALGQCLLTTMLARAQRDGIPIRAAEAVVSTKARLRGESFAPYLSDLDVDIYVDADIDEAERAELEQAAISLCGVRETLRQGPRLSERVHLGRAP